MKVQYDMNTSVENHNLIKLADPINKTDAVNLQTLEREIAASSCGPGGQGVVLEGSRLKRQFLEIHLLPRIR